MTPQQLKNSLLKLAFEGKLVPQNKNDEPISDFLNNIVCKQKELVSKRIIKVGKFDKKLPSNDGLPSGWEYTKIGLLSSLVTKQTGFDYSNVIKPSLVDHKMPNTLPLIQTRNFKGKTFNYESAFYVPDKISSLYPNLILNKKCLLLSIVGSIGNVGYCDPKEIGFLGGAITKIDLIDNTIFDYVYYYLQSPLGYAEINKNEKKTAQATITVEDVRNILIPMPPIEEQKRIVAKIEKLLPLVDRYEEAWRKLEKFNSDFPIDMEKSILQFAIQGKLTKQNNDEGTGEELFKSIQIQKNKLIKEGKISAAKRLPPVAEQDIPFEIPTTWKWCRLNDLTSVIGDGLHGTPQFDINGDYYFINGNNLDNGKIVFKDGTKKVSHEEYLKYKIPLNSNTIFMSINGTIGNLAYYDNEKIILGKSACYVNLLPFCYKEYIYIFLQSKYFIDYATNAATQTTIKNVSLQAMRNVLVPIPPLEEQKRIVAKLEELLPLCRKLAK